jgi:hypothetical protein
MRYVERVVDLAALSALTLPDASGVPRHLAALWAERPLVLVFLRHFG